MATVQRETCWRGFVLVSLAVIGLAGMRERLADLGGALDAQSGESGSVVQATPHVAACDSNDARAVDTINRPI